MHGYVQRKTEEIEEIDQTRSVKWSKDRFITSELEGYLHAIQEQGISTKYLMNKRDKDAGKIPKTDSKCRL